VSAVARQPGGDVVESLRHALQASYPHAEARDRAIKHCLSEIHALPDLQRALALVEWREAIQEEDGAVDRANQARAIEWFTTSMRRVLRQGDAPALAEALELLARTIALARASGEPATLARAFAPELADLVIQGPPRLRGVAAHVLGRCEPSVYLAVPALGELLQTGDAESRRAAAEALTSLILNAMQALADQEGVGARPAPRRLLVLTACSVLPAVHRGLDDPSPEVRRRSLEALGLACASLSRLIESPAQHTAPDIQGAPAEPRPLDAEQEELRPLVLALRDQGPMLARSLHDADIEARILAHKALEELGLGRQRWMRRCLSSGASVEGQEEALLREVLQQSVSGLAQSLKHPDVRVRRSALDALEVLGPLALPALPALTQALHDPDHFVRWSAVRAVGKLDLSDASPVVPDLTRLLNDPDVDLRRAAATALTRLNASPSIPR
jgi:HEAT repeat protein